MRITLTGLEIARAAGQQLVNDGRLPEGGPFASFFEVSISRAGEPESVALVFDYDAGPVAGRILPGGK